MATSAEFWSSSSYGPSDSNGSYELLSARSPNRYHLMRLMRKRGMRNYGEILSTIVADSRANRAPSTYPTDASGNGGGGKQAAGR